MGQLIGYLKTIRLDAGLTLVEIAKACGWTDHTHASRVERGLLPTTSDKVERWVAACGCDIYVVARTRRPAAEDALPLLAALPEANLDLVLRLARALPSLPEGDIRRLRADIRYLEGQSGTSAGEAR